MAGEEQSETKGIIPLSSKWLETLLYLLIVVWLAVLFNETLGWTNPQNWWGPMGAILLGFVLVILKLIDIHMGGWLQKLTTPPKDVPDSQGDEETVGFTQSMEDARASEDDAPPHVQDKRALVLSCWIILYPVLVFYIGFFYATPPYLIALLYYLTRDAKRTLLTAGIVLVFLYVLFVEILQVSLYSGMLDLPLLL